jgi:hypothetical protein
MRELAWRCLDRARREMGFAVMGGGRLSLLFSAGHHPARPQEYIQQALRASNRVTGISARILRATILM